MNILTGASRYGVDPAVDKSPEIAKNVQQSIDFLEEELENGRIMYGVNTGFGGSADTRSNEADKLQIALQQHLNVGILLPSDKDISLRKVNNNGLRSHALPVPIVKAMMLIRCNSLLRAHSGVRMSILQTILKLLRKGLTPIVPLRGSISASGDLSTLSYIPGFLEGNPDIHVRGHDGVNQFCIPANEALKLAGVEPVRLRAKEGLGLTNGTSASCAAASIAIHQADQIAMLTQMVTAMATEALLGTTNNYHPFISKVRPHPGQAEAAANIRSLLRGSSLATDKDPQITGLAQDRYALRTAPQWIGPQLEDLELARRQIEVELNSTTDNPLIDAANGVIHHGGNFQAVSLTSAMEKTMTAIQMMGRLMSAQCAELIDNKLNNGLPPNLSADDPGLSFTFKGFDVNMTAYMSELAYLAHPVSSHVLSSEMNNQSINSLALLASRYTLEAIEVVSLMAATYLYALCQALDLRCLHLEFVKSAQPKVLTLLDELFQTSIPNDDMEIFKASSWKCLIEHWTALSNLDLYHRSQTTVKRSLGNLIQHLVLNLGATSQLSELGFLSVLADYQKRASDILCHTYSNTREDFFRQQTTSAYLSSGSNAIYRFVRSDLGIPMHRGLVDHPTILVTHGTAGVNKKTLGSNASEIYMSLRDGRLYKVLIEALRISIADREVDCRGM